VTQVSGRYNRFQIVIGENTIVVVRIAAGKVEGFAFPMVAKEVVRQYRGEQRSLVESRPSFDRHVARRC
jgi:hypothetical protein